MAKLHSRWLYGNLLYYDDYRHRIIDAVGPGVTKFILNTAYMPVDDTTGDLTGFTSTVVEVGAGTSTAVLADNTLLITTAGNESDSLNLQLKGEAFKLDAATKYVYYGINFQINDVDQTDLFTGLFITDNEIQGGVSDGVYFESLDESADLNFVLEKNNTETTSASAVHTLVDATNVTLEFVFDGTYIDAWVDGVLQTRLATTNLPNDEFLTPTIEFENGEAAAQTMTVNWWRCIQIDGTK
jgi:hypothetical protein